MRKKQKKKINRITRSFYLSISVLMIIFSVSSIYNTIFSNNLSTTQTHTYDTFFRLRYNVNLVEDHLLIENNIINSDNIPMGQVHITALIDDIEIEIDYEYRSSIQSRVEYTYGIRAILRGTFTDGGREREVLNREYILLEPQSSNANGDRVTINESIILEIKDFYEQIQLFEQTLGMRLNSELLLLFEVDLTTEVAGERVVVNYVSDAKVEFGTRTAEVVGNLVDNNTRTLEIVSDLDREVNSGLIIFNLILLVAAVCIIGYIRKNTTVVNIMKNLYKVELNKILRICQDKIVQVNSSLQIRGDEVVEVIDFQEIIKLSEELSKPILCYISKQEEKAVFAVITNGVVYRYILKGDNNEV